MKKFKMNKKGVIGIVVAVIVIIAGVFGYKYVQAENLKKNIDDLKIELKAKYDSDTLSYLKNKKLINKDSIAFFDKKAKDVELKTNTNKTYDILKEDKTKLDVIDSDLIKSLTTKVNDKKAAVLKDVKALKASTKDEKNKKTAITKSINELVVAKDVPGLVKNLKALDLNLKDTNSLKSTIDKRIDKEQTAANSAVPANYSGSSSNYSSGSYSSGGSGKSSNSSGCTTCNAKPKINTADEARSLFE